MRGATHERSGLPNQDAIGWVFAEEPGTWVAVAVSDGRIRKGQLVLLEAMGGGFTWGASLIRW